jgi:hypothetical protein
VRLIEGDHTTLGRLEDGDGLCEWEVRDVQAIYTHEDIANAHWQRFAGAPRGHNVEPTAPV